MLTDPPVRYPSIWPAVPLTAGVVYCLAVWRGLLDGPRDFCALLAWVLGGFAVYFTVRVLVYDAVELRLRHDITTMRILEAVARMDEPQRFLAAMAINADLDDEPQPLPDGLIPLRNGQAIHASTLTRIANNVTDSGELRPERSYTVDQAAIRQGHDALHQAGIIHPAAGRRPARVRDARTFEKIVEQARR